MSAQIGKRIRHFRNQRGLTLRQLGDAVGVTGSAVSKWESGDSQVPSDDLPQITGALGVSICALYGVDEGHPQVPVTVTVAEQVGRLLGVEPARVEVNVYGRGADTPTTATDDPPPYEVVALRELTGAWPTLSADQKRRLLAAARDMRETEQATGEGDRAGA